jgi:hypothetical protein
MRGKGATARAPAAPTNGALPPADGPRLPVRTRWVDVPEYPGFRVRLRSNFAQATAIEMASGDQERMAAALAEVVLEHNGWRDEHGAPYPPAADPAFWTGSSSIPTELAGLLIALVVEEASRLPNSLRPTRPT